MGKNINTNMRNRDRFLERVNRSSVLDVVDKAAITEGVLLRSLQAYQHEADELIGVLFKAKVARV